MKKDEFRAHAHALADWMADYLESVEQFPVRSQVSPGDILKQLPQAAPEQAEAFSAVFADFERIVMPGMTHWQHPRFFAYFPCTASPPSLLAEMLTAALGAQCMLWETSPSAAEMEERMMQWLADLSGLPPGFYGAIQDGASTATLCSLLTAREKASGYAINAKGFAGAPRFTAYCSTETHSSVEKAVRIAGIGAAHLRKIEVDAQYAMRPDALERAMAKDKTEGFTPLWAVATVGTTSSTAVDPVRAIGEICKKHGVWLHVDAAYGGTAALLPEKRYLIDGIELAGSYVFNPHKWMFTHFDCSAYFVRDKEALLRTFSILPEYLKTVDNPQVNNYRDWGIPLGRRFRALKLWFVLRCYGAEGIREKLRGHIALAHYFKDKIAAAPGFEVLAPVPLGVVCFRYLPRGISLADTNALNIALKQRLNDDGKIYLTHTKLGDKVALRIAIGQTEVQQRHVDEALAAIIETAEAMDAKDAEGKQKVKASG